jgi:hypothetical protein
MRTIEGLANPLDYSRRTIIQSIENGDRWFTCLQTDQGAWQKELEIHVVEVDGEKFIRVDQEKIKADKLGELPGF